MPQQSPHRSRLDSHLLTLEEQKGMHFCVHSQQESPLLEKDAYQDLPPTSPQVNPGALD